MSDAFERARIAHEANGTCYRCGRSLVHNPHPDAGKPSCLLEVGAVGVCIPCLTSSRYWWKCQAIKAENKLEAILKILNDLHELPTAI